MIPQNITDLIKSILEKTASRKAIWGKTSRPNEYKLLFNKGAITTDNWTAEEGKECADFAIYNSFGDKIDNYYASKGEKDFELLIELHNTANREFFKVDETIAGLINEINSDKSIGKREIEKEDEDNLPF